MYPSSADVLSFHVRLAATLLVADVADKLDGAVQQLLDQIVPNSAGSIAAYKALYNAGASAVLADKAITDQAPASRVATEFIRTTFPERYALKEVDGIVNPEHIANMYFMLHQQPRDAWTHELDLRPYMEKF